MLPSLPILVFGALFMMWSRTSLASSSQAVPDDDTANDDRIVVKVVQVDKSV